MESYYNGVSLENRWKHLMDINAARKEAAARKEGEALFAVYEQVEAELAVRKAERAAV